MAKPRTEIHSNKASLSKYLMGDVVVALLWAVLISFSTFLSVQTSLFLLPIWIYIGLCLMALILPKPKPGVYPIDSKETAWWFVSFQFNRIWSFPPFKHLIFSSTVLRTLFLRCCGAKVTMNMGWSSYSTLSDPSMLEIESDVIIGIETLIVGHFIINGKLYLGKIKLKKGCLISGRCVVMAGCSVGENAVIEGGVELLAGSQIPNGTVIGKLSTISKEMRFEENMIYPGFMRPDS